MKGIPLLDTKNIFEEYRDNLTTEIINRTDKFNDLGMIEGGTRNKQATVLLKEIKELSRERKSVDHMLTELSIERTDAMIQTRIIQNNL